MANTKEDNKAIEKPTWTYLEDLFRRNNSV